MLVHDLPHMIQNLLSALQSFGEAVIQTGHLANLFRGAEQTIEGLRGLHELQQNISAGVMHMRQMEDLVRTFYQTIDVATTGAQNLSRMRPPSGRNPFQFGASYMQLITTVINEYTRQVVHANRVFSETFRMFGNPFRASDAEATEMIENATDELLDIKDFLIYLYNRIRQMEAEANALQHVQQLAERHNLSSLHAASMVSDMGLHEGALGVYSLKEGFWATLEQYRPSRGRAITFRQHLRDYLNLYYAISAIVLLFGAYRVAHRVHVEGEDFVKAASVWAVAAIVMVLIGIIVNSLSFGMSN